MVVAGMVDASAVKPLIEYEITAHQAVGDYKVDGHMTEFIPSLVSETVDTYIDMLPNVNFTQDVNFMERLWAYLSVKNLLNKVERGELYSCQQPERVIRGVEGEEEVSWEPIMCNNLERALYLSLRYHFVTPLTSLVVVKPDSTENGDIKEADMFNRKIKMMGRGGDVRAEALLVLAGIVLIIAGNN